MRLKPLARGDDGRNLRRGQRVQLSPAGFKVRVAEDDPGGKSLLVLGQPFPERACANVWLELLEELSALLAAFQLLLWADLVQQLFQPLVLPLLLQLLQVYQVWVHLLWQPYRSLLLYQIQT